MMHIRAVCLSLCLSTTALAATPVVDPARMIFFDWGKAELSGDAKTVLDRAAIDFSSGSRASMTLRSHSDRSGSATINLRMSRKRADTAAEYLRSKGVPADSIRIEAVGEADLLVDTPDGVREVQNRRIDIVF